MAIDINGNCIVFNGEALCSTPAGAEYGGVICHQGFCDTRTFGGSVAGFISTGRTSPSTNVQDTVERFPFASDTDATDVGETFDAVRQAGSSSSLTHGYIMGGLSPPQINTIQKFNFSAPVSGSDVGELVATISVAAGATDRLGDVGYLTSVGRLECFPFSSDTPATELLEITVARLQHAGHSSLEHGYASGGYQFEASPAVCTPYSNQIEKWSFSSDATCGCVGSLSAGLRFVHGNSSQTHGYTVGGQTGCLAAPPASIPGSYIDTIQKFPFSADGATSDVGELSVAMLAGFHATADSRSDGYVQYGTNFEKYPFSSDTPTSAVGSLAASRVDTTGNQV